MTDPLVEFPTELAGSHDDRTRILELWRTSEEFRSLCEELQLARRAERYWSVQTAPEASARRAEYRSLREALESEVRQRLEGKTR